MAKGMIISTYRDIDQTIVFMLYKIPSICFISKLNEAIENISYSHRGHPRTTTTGTLRARYLPSDQKNVMYLVNKRVSVPFSREVNGPL